MITAKISPDTRPAAGRVKTQDEATNPSIFQLMDLTPPPLHRPTAVVAPVIQWVVETGRPSLEHVKTVREVPNETLTPRLGEMNVILLPSVAMTL
jgi:hypothetical protein